MVTQEPVPFTDDELEALPATGEPQLVEREPSAADGQGIRTFRAQLRAAPLKLSYEPESKGDRQPDVAPAWDVQFQWSETGHTDGGPGSAIAGSARRQLQLGRRLG